MRWARVAVLSSLGTMLVCGRAKAQPQPAAGAHRDAATAAVDPKAPKLPKLPEVPEVMERAAIAKLAAADRDRLRSCFQRERAIDPAIEDHMFMLVYVKPDGKVQDMHLISAQTIDEPPRPDPPLSQKMAECLGAAVMKWTFPPTSWEGKVQLAEPLGVGGILVIFSSKPPPSPEDTAAEKVAIGAVVKQHNVEMKDCYDNFLDRRRHDRKPLRVEVKMTIEKGGMVSDASILEPARLETKFKGCVLNVARKMKFPEPRDGKTIITYPFIFSPER